MIIKCPNCSSEHPEYFSTCPNCNLDRLSPPPKKIDPKTTDQIFEHDNSLNIFDFSFKNFTAPRLLKIVYLPSIILSTIALVMGILMISDLSVFTLNEKWFFSILAVIGYFHSVILLRITCELCLVLFKIERNTRR